MGRVDVDELAAGIGWAAGGHLRSVEYTRSMSTINASDARLQSLLDQAAISHAPVHIAGKRNAGVLIGEDDWRDIQETLYLLSVPGMRESIVKGIKTPESKCSRSLKW